MPPTMADVRQAKALVDRLRAAGVRLGLAGVDYRLQVSPASKLSVEDRGALAQQKAAVVTVLVAETVKAAFGPVELVAISSPSHPSHARSSPPRALGKEVATCRIH